MKKRRLLTARGELMENPMTWEQQEVFRLLKAQPGTMYQEADIEVRKYFRDWVRGLLDVAEITVTFVKADGTLRDMRCTLNRDFIPTQPTREHSKAPVDGIVREDHEKAALVEPEENHTQKVFDLDAFAWRSFRYDRLKKVTATMSFE
jgi:hypothetical protein